MTIMENLENKYKNAQLPQNLLASFTLRHVFGKTKQSQFFEQGDIKVHSGPRQVYVVQRKSTCLRNGWLGEMTYEIESFVDFQK